MKVETAAEQLFFTTAFLTARSGTRTSTGTGFVYQIDSEVGAHHLLVTNKHLIVDFDTLTIRFVRSQEGKPLLGVVSEVTVDLHTSEWVGHPNDVVDVAIVPLSVYVNHLGDIGEPAFFKTVDSNLALGVDFDVELNALEEVTFIGYPAGLYDSYNYLPIARRGMTATPLGVNYQNQPCFLIDASVHPGSSGSPVFILNHGWIADRSGNVTVGRRLIFLGLIASNYNTTNQIDVIEIPTGHVALVKEAIGLGLVYKAVCVDECAAIFLSSHGMTRVKSAPRAET